MRLITDRALFYGLGIMVFVSLWISLFRDDVVGAGMTAVAILGLTWVESKDFRAALIILSILMSLAYLNVFEVEFSANQWLFAGLFPSLVAGVVLIPELREILHELRDKPHTNKE